MRRTCKNLAGFDIYGDQDQTRDISDSMAMPKGDGVQQSGRDFPYCPCQSSEGTFFWRTRMDGMDAGCADGIAIGEVTLSEY